MINCTGCNGSLCGERYRPLKRWDHLVDSGLIVDPVPDIVLCAKCNRKMTAVNCATAVVIVAVFVFAVYKFL